MAARTALRPACALVLALPGMLNLSIADARAFTIEGYADPPSVAQGDTVSICVSTDAPFFTAEVIRSGGTRVTYDLRPGVPGLNQPVPERAYAEGCDWPPSLRLAVPPAWPSGVYEVKLTPEGGGDPGWAIFTVREDHPGSTSRILFTSSINTWHAYNAWGGKCLYDTRSSDHHRSEKVSFRRPYAAPYGTGQYRWWEQYCVQYLEQLGYTLEFCTDIDTHARPELDDAYDLLIIVGHAEYWSHGMRDNVEARIARGQHVMILGGNTCWWQVRYSPGMDQVICYKDKCIDPRYTGAADSLVTVNWWEWPVLKPENTMTGVGWRNGGYVNAQGWFPAGEGWGGYTVCRPEHWVYEGTGVDEGDVFGQAAQIVGGETDGALFLWQHGRPVATGGNGSPRDFEILAYSPASHGFATMGLYTAPSGAVVFNGASVRWAVGLEADPVVQRVARNVVARLAGPPPDPVPAPPPVEALAAYPSPSRGGVYFAWCTPGANCRAFRIYDAGGRLVSQVEPEAVAERGAAHWSGRDREGRLVTPGVYFAVLDAGGVTQSAKFILAR